MIFKVFTHKVIDPKELFFNKALRILLTTNALILLAAATLAPIYALYVEKIGGDLMAASITGAVFALTAGIVVLFSAKISDKIKRAEIIVVLGYLLIGLGFLLFIFANSILFLLLIQVIIGLGEAIYAPAFDKLYSAHLTPAKTGREWGAWEATHYFSIAIGAVLGGLVVTTFGFNVLFIIMSLLCFLSAFYIYRLPKHIL